MFSRKMSLLNSLLAGAVLAVAPMTYAEVIFSDSFDRQPDWTSGLPENDRGGLPLPKTGRGGWNVDIEMDAKTHKLPTSWDFVRQTPAFAPSRGDADRHETIEISAESTAENANRAKGGTGKSFVKWRDSTTKSWDSDGMLVKYFPEGYSQMYVEFWINFSNELIATYYGSTTQNMAKLFRIYHWDGLDATFDYFSPDQTKHPTFLWQYEGRSQANKGYGFRNLLTPIALRVDRYGKIPSESLFLDSNRNPTNSIPTSFNASTLAQFGGSALADKRDGGLVSSSIVDIDQVFGDETKWTKIAFFVKMNSAPGVYDGQLIQWIDDRKAIDIKTMQWIAKGFEMVKWNVVALGGNDFFNESSESQRREEWFAIDDIRVLTEIPANLMGDSEDTSPPNPPLTLTID